MYFFVPYFAFVVELETQVVTTELDQIHVNQCGF